MSKRPLAAALCAAMALTAVSAAAPAVADPKGCPPGLAKQGRCGGGGHDRGHYDDRRRDDYDRRVYHRGDHIDRDRVVVIERWRDRGYPAPPRGHRYVEVDGQVLLIAIASNVIADILTR